jgi:hypothetical protein
MTKKSVPITSIVVLMLSTMARADYFTTNVTIQPPAIPSQGNVVRIDFDSGLSYTNSIGTPNPGMAGSPADRVPPPGVPPQTEVRAIGAAAIGNYTLGSGGTGFGSTPGNRLVAVFAVDGVAVAPTSAAQFTGFFSVGKLQVWNIFSNTFNASDPGTWGQFTPGAVQLAQYDLNPLLQNISPGTDPQGFNISRPASILNLAATNAVIGAQSTLDFLFTQTAAGDFDDLLTAPNPIDGLLVDALEVLTNSGNPWNDTQEMQINAIYNALVGKNFDIDDPFNPTPGSTPPFATGDTVQTLVGSAFPLGPQNQPPPPGVIPEPASLLLWGTLTASFGTLGSLRRRRLM